MANDAARTQLMCAKLIMLSKETLLYIEKNILQITSTYHADSCDLTSLSKVKPENTGAVATGSKNNVIWKKYGCFLLTNLHKAHLRSYHDIHIGAAQELIRKQFPPLWWTTEHCGAKFRDAEVIER